VRRRCNFNVLNLGKLFKEASSLTVITEYTKFW
jgi:hypothetical protein